MKSVPALTLTYREPEHRDYPHVVKFSGGRSSALLLFALLESNQLDALRGDIIIFNNTSAEHRRTYDFVIRCKREAERISDIPFLLTEFQTIETARNGYWRRVGSWRLAKPYLWRRNRPLGMRHRGEIFEESTSLDTRLPNRFQRLCTDHLKVQVTRQALAEWFSGAPATQRLGHWHQCSQLDERELLSAFRGRSLTPEELLRYTEFVRSRPLCATFTELLGLHIGAAGESPEACRESNQRQGANDRRPGRSLYWYPWPACRRIQTRAQHA